MKKESDLKERGGGEGRVGKVRKEHRIGGMVIDKGKGWWESRDEKAEGRAVNVHGVIRIP